jgi:CDP-glycerol glycerophosphotransferase (TagB/SpsB family)
MGLERYTRIGFPNRGRLRNYVTMGVVSPEQAALVGFPKLDALLADARDPKSARAALGLEPERPTAIYAPTFSPCSSLQESGELIVETLLAAGYNVIVKLHDRSLDPDPRYSGGVDWRGRFHGLADPERLLFAEYPDSNPYLRASDIMVTDHSTIGFEFCALDRPVIVYDAPQLLRAARINPAKWRLLRGAATVARDPRELARVADTALASPGALAAERRHAAREVFYQPGSATARALALVYELLGLERIPSISIAPIQAQTRAGAA